MPFTAGSERRFTMPYAVQWVGFSSPADMCIYIYICIQTAYCIVMRSSDMCTQGCVYATFMARRFPLVTAPRYSLCIITCAYCGTNSCILSHWMPRNFCSAVCRLGVALGSLLGSHRGPRNLTFIYFSFCMRSHASSRFCF